MGACSHLSAKDADKAAGFLAILFESKFEDGVQEEDIYLAGEYLRLSNRLYLEGDKSGAFELKRMGLQCDPRSPYVVAFFELLKRKLSSPKKKKG